MHQAIQDGICQSGIGNAAVPISDRNLCGDQGGSMSEAIIKDFQNILCVLDGNGIAHPIIEYQQIAFGEGTQRIRQGTITAYLGKRVQQARGAVVTYGETCASGGSSEGTSQKRFS